MDLNKGSLVAAVTRSMWKILVAMNSFVRRARVFRAKLVVAFDTLRR